VGAGLGDGQRHPVHADDPGQRRRVQVLRLLDTPGPDQRGHEGHGPGSRAYRARPGPGRAMTVAASTPAEAAAGPAEQSTDRAGVAVRPASAWWVLVAGVVGLAAALTLTVEKINMLTNPSYTPSCSLNPVLSCGSVMVTPQASAFGFPNPLIGIVAFTVVVVTGVLAVGHISLPRWYWLGLAG